jgi:hypothetical protein
MLEINYISKVGQLLIIRHKSLINTGQRSKFNGLHLNKNKVIRF